MEAFSCGRGWFVLKGPGSWSIVSGRMTVTSSVLLITPRWVRDGGVGAHIEASAAALTQRGVRVSVVAARIESDERIPGVDVHHSPKLFKSEFSMEERFGGALSSSYSVIHLNQLDEPDVVRFLQQRSPVVISAHGYIACTSGVHYFRPGQECMRAHGPGCIANLPRCAHTRNPRGLPASYRQATRALMALRQADVAVSYSSAVDRHLELNSVTRRRIVPYCPTVTAKPATLDGPRRRVVCAGRVVTPKGVSTLIRAARLVEAEFIICGDGWQLSAMRKLAVRLGLQDRVSFTGWLAPDALAQELANASVVVVPSWWPEPFGLVGIEAFAAGRPVVASATGGIGDWLDDGISGLMVPAGDEGALADALNELLKDPERQAAMGAAGRAATAARFSIEHHVEAILEAYGAARAGWELGQGDGSDEASRVASTSTG
jgi:glycosyltransferase involved in cell wall biosynthesis